MAFDLNSAREFFMSIARVMNAELVKARSRKLLFLTFYWEMTWMNARALKTK